MVFTTDVLAKLEVLQKHNKLAGVFFQCDKLEQAEKHFTKAAQIAIEIGLPYSNVYQNLGNLHAQKKDYARAKECYEFVLKISPHSCDSLYPEMKQRWGKDGSGAQDEHSFLLYSDKMNSWEAFVDAHTNLSFTLLGMGLPEQAIERCKQSLALKPNKEAHINFGNSLRQIGRREEACRFVQELVSTEQDVSKSLGKPWTMERINVDNISSQAPSDDEEVWIITVKWGTKYDSGYVNKLWNGFKRHSNRPFRFVCFTDNAEGLLPEIEPRKLVEDWKGWWGKASIFSSQHGMKGLKFFIDLDMIVTGSVDDLFRFKGKFALLRTDELECETLNKGGYNSSVVLWRDDQFEKIYTTLRDCFEHLTKYIYRFDYWLEMIVGNSEFAQDLYPGQIRDYLSECQDPDNLPQDTRIVAFPRDPKPHEVVDQKAWVRKHWV